jgi:hypothetical protein
MRCLAVPRGLLLRFGMGFCVRALFMGFRAQNNVCILVVLRNVRTLTIRPKSFLFPISSLAHEVADFVKCASSSILFLQILL